MYAPVASRFRTYVPDLRAFGDDGTAAAYIDALFALPAMEAWARGAREETAG
jgi:glutathione S-transferase